MSLPDLPPLFWEIHQGLPREGPGDKHSTHRAYGLVNDLPPEPIVLDIGCGPGQQTLDLAEICPGKITAIDLHPPFLAELQRRAQAAGLSGRIQTCEASMFELPFADQSFDLIWCEGAAYFMGLEAALKTWKRLLKPKGYLCLTDCCWLQTAPPPEVRKFWAEYPTMTDIDNSLKEIHRQGYRSIGHFVLPDSAWWEDYYTPMLARIAALKEKYAQAPEALDYLTESEQEAELHRQFSTYYGYVFFVMQVHQTAP